MIFLIEKLFINFFVPPILLFLKNKKNPSIDMKIEKFRERKKFVIFVRGKLLLKIEKES